MGTEKEKKEAGPRNFGVFLANMEEGGFMADLSTELQRANADLAKHAEHHGKAKGAITVVVELAYESNGTVEVRGEIKTKLPKSKRARSMFWDLGDGNLSNENPKQKSLPFREVNADSPVKDIAGPGRVVKEVGNG
jgi:hypothetical protein